MSGQLYRLPRGPEAALEGPPHLPREQVSERCLGSLQRRHLPCSLRSGLKVQTMHVFTTATGPRNFQELRYHCRQNRQWQVTTA